MVIELNDTNFNKTIAEGITLVDFWAPWCGPCRMQAPMVEALAHEYDGKVKVGKVNVDQEIALTYRFNVMSIPTVMVFRDGKVAEKRTGVQSIDDLREMVK